MQNHGCVNCDWVGSLKLLTYLMTVFIWQPAFMHTDILCNKSVVFILKRKCSKSKLWQYIIRLISKQFIHMKYYVYEKEI